MSEEHVATPTDYDGSSTMPEDGDDIDAASVRISLEEHSDAIAQFQEIIKPAGSPRIWRHLGVPLADGIVDGEGCSARIIARWAGDGTDDLDGWPSPGVATAGGESGDPLVRWSFSYLLQLPQGAILQEVRVFFYRDVETVGCSVFVRRRNYRNAIDPGGSFEGADIPESTFVGAGSTIVTVDGGMRRVDVEMTHTVDRSDTGYEYAVYVRGYGAARFMPQVLAGFDLATHIDQGAA